MVRPLCILFPGAVYYVMARGNHCQPIFRDHQDRPSPRSYGPTSRRRWLGTLGEACVKTGWSVHAFVLMGNHYHLLLETPEPNLVAGIKCTAGPRRGGGRAFADAGTEGVGPERRGTPCAAQRGGGEGGPGLVVAAADDGDAALGGGAAGPGPLYAGDPGGEPGRAQPVAAGGPASRLLAAEGRPGDAVSMQKCHYSRTDPLTKTSNRRATGPARPPISRADPLRKRTLRPCCLSGHNPWCRL